MNKPVVVCEEYVELAESFAAYHNCWVLAERDFIAPDQWCVSTWAGEVASSQNLIKYWIKEGVNLRSWAKVPFKRRGTIEELCAEIETQTKKIKRVAQPPPI